MTLQGIYKSYRRDIKQTVWLSLPIIVGQLSNILMGLCDNAMVGAIEPEAEGAAALAAAGVSNSIYVLVTVIGLGVMLGVSTLVSISKVKKNYTECGEYLKYALVSAFLVSVVLTLILIIVANNFHWFAQVPEVEKLAKPYLLILAFGTFPMLGALGLKNFSDGLSFTKPPMIIMLAGVGLNVFLNWLFIYGHWGITAMGLNGAGYATVLARLFIFTALLLYIYKSSLYAGYRKYSRRINLASPQHIEIYKIGVPSGLQYFFEVGAFSAASVIAGWISPFHSAAHQVAITLAAASYMGATGISAAGAIRVGAASADKNPVSVRKAGIAALILVILFMLVTAVIFLAFHNLLPPLFNKYPEVINTASVLLIIAALFQFSDGAQCVALGILRGLKDVRYPTAITLIAYWAVGLPLAYWMAFPLDMGVKGIWYGLTLGLTVSAVLLSRRFIVLSSGRKGIQPNLSA